MSTRKRKLSPDLQGIFEEIQSVLTKIKPKLNDSRQSAWIPLRTDLLQIAVLAESFTKQRPRSNKEWRHLADTLDREGVNLWNASTLIREATDDGHRSIFAALRLAGFRLIEAGLEQKPGIETLTHVLQLASKAGASLSEIGSNDLAASVLGCAAKYEESLRSTDDPQGVQARSRARATMVYYSSRMEAAWREGNDGIADFMLEKVTENDQCLSLLPPPDRTVLAAKLLEIGKTLLRTGSRDSNHSASNARKSIKWIQKSFSIIEPLEDAGDADNRNLKRSILRSLARAYFLSSSEDPDNLTRAEASLHELIASVDSSVDHTSAEYQQLRWMRIAILKRRKAGTSALLDAFQSIIDHMEFSEGNITDILQELRTFTKDHILVASIHQHCLRRALEADNRSTLACVDRLLLSLIFHCSKDEDHTRAMQEAENALTCLSSSDYELSKISTTACLTLLWQFGDRQYHAKRWLEAADWFLIGTHRVFGTMSHICNPKCFRKAALCHIQRGELAQASAVIRRCSSNEAATYYVALLIAVRQGLEDEAIRAAEDMVNASNFNRKMLLLATSLANESGMKTLLLSVLEALLKSLQTRESLEVDLEAITLVRCIIRLVLKLLVEPASNMAVLVPVLIGHFSTAKSLVEAMGAKKNAALVAKDISWLWRTAYNCAVQGCSQWENSEEKVCDLFDIARQLLEVYSDSVLADADQEVYTHIIYASFAAVAGRVFAIRHVVSNDVTEQATRLRTIYGDITSCKKRIQGVIDNEKLLDNKDLIQTASFLHVLRVFETEIACQLKDWTRALDVVQELIRSDALAVNTFEAIADILWVEKDCPTEVLFTALEAILHASLDRATLSVEKFSRWMRAICTILLSRNSAADRAKAIRYVEQAVNVLEDQSTETDSEETYPLDERQWLLGTSYNTGVECLHASLLDEAKRWFEASTTVCRFVPDGENRAEKISEMYAQLLARYSSSMAPPNS